MADLDLRDVGKSFSGREVLTDVDLHVADGTTVSLLGPSGSGKSTLLRIVAGLTEPDSGTVALGGRDVTGLPAHRRGVGVVFQDQALFPHLDVAGNVGFGLRMLGVDGRDRRPRVAEVLELVGLPGHERRDPATLSGGEAQRVALARALAPRPSVVLLDEPLAALDQLLRERLLVELRAVFDDLAVTVVAVTHDPTEAAALGDRIAVLVDGRIAQEGPTGEVITTPVSAEVAGLVGQRNVVPGDVVGGAVRTALGVLHVTGAGRDRAVAVLIPPLAIRPDPHGALHGVVRSLLYRSGTPMAIVGDVGPGAPATGGLTLEVPAGTAWSVGDEVALALDDGAVHLMAR